MGLLLLSALRAVRRCGVVQAPLELLPALVFRQDLVRVFAHPQRDFPGPG
jgi:hypothetical protein